MLTSMQDASHTVSVDRLSPISLSRSRLGDHSHERDNKASHASTTVSKRLQTRFLLTKKFPLSNEYLNKSSCFEC
jgi:hypothetical protein